MSVLQKKIRPLFSAFFSAGKYHKQEHTEKKKIQQEKNFLLNPSGRHLSKSSGGSLSSPLLPHTSIHTFKFKINAADPGAYPNVHP